MIVRAYSEPIDNSIKVYQSEGKKALVQHATVVAIIQPDGTSEIHPEASPEAKELAEAIIQHVKKGA